MRFPITQTPWVGAKFRRTSIKKFSKSIQNFLIFFINSAQNWQIFRKIKDIWWHWTDSFSQSKVSPIFCNQEVEFRSKRVSKTSSSCWGWSLGFKPIGLAKIVNNQLRKMYSAKKKGKTKNKTQQPPPPNKNVELEQVVLS